MSDLFEKINNFNRPIQNRPIILIMKDYSFIYGVITEASIDYENWKEKISFYTFDNNAINSKLSGDSLMMNKILANEINADMIQNIITIYDIQVWIDLMAKAKIYPFKINS